MIDQSLKEKISANDQKLKSLFNLKKNINNKTSNIINPSKKKSKISLNNITNLDIKKEKTNSSFVNISNKENQRNLINLDISRILNTNVNLNTKLINYEKFHSFIKPTKNIKEEKNDKKKPQIKLKGLECFINIKQSNNNLPKKNKKIKNISKSQPNKTDRSEKTERTQRNISISKSNKLENVFFSQKKMSKSFDFNLTYERFIENETKKNSKILKLKKNREKIEKKIFPHQPKINKKSKKLNKSITDDFLIRLEKYKKSQIEKDEILKKNILKDEEEKINKNNFLIKQKKLKKKRLNESVDKIYNNKTITESVNKLFDWDKKRKEKLQKEIKKQALIEKNIHIPKINKSKNTIFKKDKIIQKIFDRLYNNNKYIFEFKKELLTEESTPKFNSLLNKTNSQPNISYNLKKIISSRSGFNKKYKEEVIINEKICDTDNYNNTINDNNNDDEIKIINNTDRMVFNNIDNNINKTSFSREYKEDKEEKSKTKSLIVVIRKVKSQIDILNKKK
jgi:hypothetical protein